jgi:hypothetical protein
VTGVWVAGNFCGFLFGWKLGFLVCREEDLFISISLF